MIKVPLLLLQKKRRIYEKRKLINAMRKGELVRLHVVAAGDSDEEQRVKMIVRDSVLLEFADLLKQAHSCSEALSSIKKNLNGIRLVAKSAAEREGYFGYVGALIGAFDFPDKTYNGVRVPHGTYDALRIVLGNGSGQNWWCILYPALCLSTLTNSTVDIQNISFEWHLPDIFKLWF